MLPEERVRPRLLVVSRDAEADHGALDGAAVLHGPQNVKLIIDPVALGHQTQKSMLYVFEARIVLKRVDIHVEATAIFESLLIFICARRHGDVDRLQARELLDFVAR